MTNYKIIIKKAFIIDGSLKPGYHSDVGIIDGKIAFIGRLSSKDSAEVEIDGTDLVLSPGFIDPHDHSDYYLLHVPSGELKIKQGVTTTICGCCGISLFPLSKMKLLDVINSPNDNLLELVPTVNTSFTIEELMSFDEYLKYMDKLPLGINCGFFVGQGSIRAAIMGLTDRRPTEEELSIMKALLKEALSAGAFGLSSGLIYPPGSYTTTEELIELCQVVAKYNAKYATHLRSEGNYIIEAIKEAITIGRRSGVEVIISHHKIIGKKNWGLSQETLRLIDKANKEGIRVDLDQYPYLMTSTVLNALIPKKYHIGGLDKLVERLKDKKNQDELKKEIDPFLLEHTLILDTPYTPETNGKWLKELAEERNKDIYETIFEMLINNNGKGIGAFNTIDKEDLEKIMRHSRTMICSDGILVPIKSNIHPRATSTFPRILGKYVREKRILSLTEAIHKMTFLTAKTLRIANKGLVKEGYDADLVLFDPKTINDLADFANPYRNNVGIKYVIVNGKLVFKNGIMINTNSGKIVTKN